MTNARPDKRILLVGAMDTEIGSLKKEFKLKQTKKLSNVYPLYTNKNNTQVSLVETFVGDLNASLASYLAIGEVKPDYVIKIGCVGGNSADIHRGDILLADGYFHSASWITRSKNGNKPTGDASVWQSVFGELPYQVNSHNLGERPYFFDADKKINSLLKKSLKSLKLQSQTAYIGGGNMWFFDVPFMKNVADTHLPAKAKHQRWVADMESYAIAHSCNIAKIPFAGLYVVSNSDYYDEPYVPESIPTLFDEHLSKVIRNLID